MKKPHSRAKIDQSDLALIRSLLDEKEKIRKQCEALTYDAIGDKFGITGHAVRQIASRRSWGTFR
jgi:hypothetical protein